MADTLSTYFIEFKASMDGLIAPMKEAADQGKELEKTLKPLTDTAEELGKVMVVAGTAVVAGMTAMTVSAANFGEHLNKLHEMTGISTETLSGLGYAATQNETTIDALSTGLKFLAKNMEAAIDKAGPQRDAFARLGVTTKDLTDVHGDLNKVFLLVADRFKEMPDGAEKSALSVQIFGKAGAELIPTLNQGSSGLAEFQKKAEALGLTMSGDASKAADAFNDAMDDVKQAFLGLSIAVGSELMPSMKRWVDFARDSVMDVTAFTKAHEGLSTAIFDVGGALVGSGGLLIGLSQLPKAFTSVSTGLSALGGVATLTTLAWVALAAELVIVAKLLYDVSVAEKDHEKAVTELGAATEKAAAVLKDKYGVSIQQGTMSIDEWNAAVVKSLQEHQKLDTGLQDSTKRWAEYRQGLEDIKVANAKKAESDRQAALAMQVHRDEIDALVKSFDKENEKGKDLEEELKQLVLTHHSMDDIVRILGKSTDDYRDSVVESGKTVGPYTKQVADLWQAHLDLKKAQEETTKAQNEFFKSVDAMVPVIQEAMRQMIALWQGGFQPLNAEITILHGLLPIVTQAQIDYTAAMKDQAAQAEINKATTHLMYVDELNDQVAAAEGINVLRDQDRKRTEDQKKNAEELKKANSEIRDSAGHVWDDMFTKGQSVFESLINLGKGFANTLGRTIFQDIAAALFAPLQQEFDHFFNVTVKAIIDQALSGIAKTIAGWVGSVFGSGSDFQNVTSGHSTTAGSTAKGAAGAAGGAGGMGTTGAVVGGAVVGYEIGKEITKSWLDSQAHWEANALVQGVESYFWEWWGKLLPTDNMDALAALPPDQAAAIAKSLNEVEQNYLKSGNEFALHGKDENQVWQQSLANTQPHFMAAINALNAAVNKGTSASSTMTTTSGLDMNVGTSNNEAYRKILNLDVDTYNRLFPPAATGIDYVPYDNYLARLHKGERVQTAEEASSSRMSPTLQFYLNIAPGVSNGRQVFDEFMRILRNNTGGAKTQVLAELGLNRA
jgi:hypothetical protein